MKIKNTVILFLTLTYLPVLIYASSGVQHTDPQNDSLIPITGWPFYLENLEIGSPLSDYGSHFGIKATVDNDGDNYPRFDSPNRIDAGHFLNMAHYAAITSFYGQVDQSYLWFKETSPGSPEHLKPADSRSIQFSPYGWTEIAGDSSITASGSVFTLDTDTFLFVINVKNISSSAITLTPHLTIFKDSDPQREGTNVYGSSSGGCNSSNIDSGNNVLSFVCDGKRESKDIKFVRAIKSSETINSANLIKGEKYEIDIELGSIILSQNEQREIILVLGYAAEGDAVNDAINLALSGWTKVQSEGGATATINNIVNDWDNFFNNLPVPHTYDSKYIQLYKMAATALRMNLYKKRNAMPADCSVPGKAHFNFFWAWDTPFHTLGQCEWDIQLAKDNLTTQFSGQVQNGMIRMVIDDNLSSSFWPDFTQPPVQGWAIKKIAEMDGFKDNDWLQDMFLKSKGYLNYWESVRDNDNDGLYEFSSGLETGWDDTPRFHCPKKTNICVAMTDKIDSVDLNSWLYIYYKSMEEIAEQLGELPDREEFKEKAELLRKNIEEKLWDGDAGAYFDRELKDSGEHEFIKVLTPAIAFPLFAGTVLNHDRAKRLIEGHILNPDEFWGKYPVPTVAYNAPEYDHDDDGYYWQGQVWLMTAYSTLTALYKYGYENEAEELRKKILDMMFNADPGGIHETYDALTGKVGWGAGSNGYFGGIGEPSVFQFGWSSAFTMEILLDRYQRERFLMPSDSQITGFIRKITQIKSDTPYIEIIPDRYEQPLLTLESGSKGTIIDSKSIYIKMEDPYNVFSTTEPIFKVYVHFNAKIGEVLTENGSVNWITPESDSKGNFFQARITGEESGVRYYLIILQPEGCGCNAGNRDDNYGLFIILSVFAISFIILKNITKITSTSSQNS